jgi:threonine dehydratase
MIQAHDVHAARERLRSFLLPTPLESAPGMANVWLKLENANRTHSFKIRGALNALTTRVEQAHISGSALPGVVTASSGNHAQGMACAAALLRASGAALDVRICMSRHAAARKIAGVRRFGIEPTLIGDSYDDAEREALRLSRDDGLTYISPYNHPLVAVGNGTTALEIVEALPQVERVIVPVGGGGLIGGCAVALKAYNPQIEVIGVNAAVSPEMYNAFYGEALPLSADTLADALPGDIEAGSITLELARRCVDQMVLVDEAAIAAAMRWMLTEAGWLAEGGGVVGVAALQAGIVPLDERPTAVIVSGGNVDGAVLRRVLAES